jgi:putative nucleotidyltransferase with HDIG domain
MTPGLRPAAFSYKTSYDRLVVPLASVMSARRTSRRLGWNDVGLAAASIVLVVAAYVFSGGRPALAVFAVTGVASTSAMYARLAIGRWAAAAQILAGGLLLALLGAPPRLVGVVLGCSLAAAALAPRSTSRAGLLRSASFIAALAGAIMLSGNAATAPAPWTRVVGEAVAAAAAGFLAAPSLLAFAPLAEWLFHHVTPLTLTEWLNYDHPLLRQLATRAPGTFQHSVSVGLLADAGARAIGANPLLARVGGLFHDVGKIRAPGYFYENQTGHNPHDELDPETSAGILRAHVADGVALVTAHHMGSRLADFVREHHGTGVMHVFRDKAARLGRLGAAGDGVFRYDGPRPRSCETAVVMIADQLEASVRASLPADMAACEAVTAQTIERIAASGELTDAPIDDRDRDRLGAALAGAVFAMYHRRLRYPDAAAPAATLAGRWLGRRGGAA